MGGLWSMLGNVAHRFTTPAARQLRWLLAAALVASMSTFNMAGPAQANPHNPTPTAAQVAAAQAHARQVAAALAQTQATVSTAQSRLDALNTDLEILVEKWNGAQADVVLASRQLAATQASEASAKAQAQFAQIDVDRLAVASYQFGPDLAGGMGQWVAIADGIARSGGITDLTDQAADIGFVSAAAHKTMSTAVALRGQAAAATAETARALADVQAKQAVAANALSVMRQRQEAQKTEVRRLTADLTTARAALTKARQAATSLAHQRSVGLARAAAAAAAARARAQAKRRAEQHTNSGGQSTTSGSNGSSNNGDRHDPSSYVGHYPQGTSHTTVQQRLGALSYARAHIGDPYIAGRDGPHAFDCSGLTSAAYRSMGWSMIHFSQSQFLAGEKIPLSDLQPGDLVFYATDPADWHTIHHVVLYEGNGMMIEAPHTGAFVREWSMYPQGLVPYGARP